MAHGQRGFITISVIDTAAIGISIAALVAVNQAAAPDHLPFLVASFASSVIVLFSLPGLDIARTWNVVGGQFLGALAGFLVVTAVGDDHLALAAGASVALASVFMKVSTPSTRRARRPPHRGRRPLRPGRHVPLLPGAGRHRADRRLRVGGATRRGAAFMVRIRTPTPGGDDGR